jgi:formylglycine-generating enzyme required for sulfatase activity
MEFVTIGNPNPVGSVAYTYNLGKYEVSRGQIDKANSAGSLGITYTFQSSTVNKPGTGISYYEAAKYVNWLNTSTGGTAAYKFDGSGNFQLWSSTDAGYNASNKFRNSNAKFWLPSTDEWYKGAYGSPNGTWYNYPTGSNSAPTAVAGGTDANTAVFGGQSGPADITSAGGLSAYGTMGQGGNVWEWMETAYDGTNDTAGEIRQIRGGVWNYEGSFLGASYISFGTDPASGSSGLGFRVASVPEPSAFSLLAVGLGGLAMIRRRRS